MANEEFYPPYPLTLKTDQGNPIDKASGIAKEREGVHDSFDEESATFLDRTVAEPIVAPRRTDYHPDQVGCGGKFHPELNKNGQKGCGPDVSAEEYNNVSSEGIPPLGKPDSARFTTPEDYRQEFDEDFEVIEPFMFNNT